MASTPVQGLADSYSLLDRIPQAARDQLAVEEARIGYEVLAAQQRDAPKRTGGLSGALSVQLMIEELRVRIGLLAPKARRFFYGRIIERGRRAQIVSATRGGTSYKLRVGALAAHPFIQVERPEIRADQRLAAFWGQVLANSGAQA
jgi:hypothetical protein